MRVLGQKKLQGVGAKRPPSLFRVIPESTKKWCSSDVRALTPNTAEMRGYQAMRQVSYF